MFNPVRTLINKATNRRDRLVILDFTAHEPYQSMLAMTGHTFLCIDGLKQVRKWNRDCRPVPDNYILVDVENDGDKLIDQAMPDLILTHNKLAHLEIAHSLSRRYHIPIAHMEHTLPFIGWHPQQTTQVRDMKTDISCTISEYNRNQWGYGPETHIIHHGIDADTFCPDVSVPKQNRIITCVNDFINRDWCCGYRIFMEATKGLPTRIRGNTPGLSEGTKSTEELVNELRSSLIYCNSSTVSPVPTATLEAAACGLAIVTTSTCMLPEIFTHKVDALLYPPDRIDLGKKYLEQLLNDPDRAIEMGKRARQTIMEKFSIKDFVDNWNRVLTLTANTPYRGT